MANLILFISYFFLFFTSTYATYTRVENTYMKTPESCCSLVPDDPAPKCALTSIQATERVQLAYSPKFPGRFPIGKMCMWVVQSRFGHQVRLEFRDFYLIGPDKNKECSDQYVVVESPITGHSMGRFCGNSGIPTIVSAGNLLVVKLYSEIPMSSENFRGFAFVFRETMEAPNLELRPENWKYHAQFSLTDNEVAKELRKLKPTNVPSPGDPTPSVSFKSSSPTSSETAQNSNIDNQMKSPTNTIKKNSNKKYLNNAASNIHRKKELNIYGANQNRDIIIHNKVNTNPELPLSLEAIIGIGVGAVCATALLILIICKVNQVCKRRDQAASMQAATNEVTDKNNPCEQLNTETLENLSQVNTNKTFELPRSTPTSEGYGPHLGTTSLPPDYYSTISSYPNYCTTTSNNVSSPQVNTNFGVNAYSNTIPRVFYPNGGLPAQMAYPLMNPPQPANMLLYDPNSGMLYDPQAAVQQQAPFLVARGQTGQEPSSFQSSNVVPPGQVVQFADDDDSSDTDTETDSSYERDRAKSSRRKKEKKRRAKRKKHRRKK